jgi:hypothetical protein
MDVVHGVFFTGPPAEAKKYMTELVVMDAGMEPLVIHREAVVPLDVTYDDIKSSSIGLTVTDKRKKVAHSISATLPNTDSQ